MKTISNTNHCLVALLVFLAASFSANAASWVVSSGQSLQAAISNAAAGDNITVMSGTYNENIFFNKGLTIQGSGGSVLVTGFLTVTNATLPVYLSDFTFGQSGASGIAVNYCQSFRMDRCILSGGGDFNSQNSTIYCYKDTFTGNVNLSKNIWTMQRSQISGSLASSSSTAKFIASTVNVNFNHSVGEITIFQSTLNGTGNNIGLTVTDNGWVCYSTLFQMNFGAGNFQVVGNHIGNIGLNGSLTYFYSGCNATIRNNVYANDGRYNWGGWHNGSTAISIESNAGLVNIFNNTIWNVCRGIGINGSPSGVVIRGNIFSSPNAPDWFVSTGAAGVIIDKNDSTAGINGGIQTGNIFADPQFANTTIWAGNSCALLASSPCINTGPTVDATFLNFDGTTNTMGAYGGHSYDPTGLSTTNPVVLSGSVTPLYVKQGQAVTVSARAAVVAAP